MHKGLLILSFFRRPRQEEQLPRRRPAWPESIRTTSIQEGGGEHARLSPCINSRACPSSLCCSLCEAVLQAQTLPLLEQLRSDWTAQGGASQPPSGDSSSRRDGALAGGGGGGGGERLERSLVALLQRSHFVSISAGDMELAEQLAADSVLTLPITVPKPEEGGEGGVLPEQGPSIMLFRLVAVWGQNSQLPWPPLDHRILAHS